MDQSTMIRADITPVPDTPPRLDVYGAVHKGLRAFMFDTLMRVGRADPSDAAQFDEALAQTRALLSICGEHLQHENAFVHAAIEARRAGAARRTADDHAEHEQAIAALSREADTLATAPPTCRGTAMHRFYLQLAHFVAENLEHMAVEETHNTAVLRDAYSDEEIGAMLHALVMSIPPASSAVFHRWMFAAMTHAELAGLLGALRAQAPAPVFDAEVARARDVLPPRDWAKLTRALALPAGAAVLEPW